MGHCCPIVPAPNLASSRRPAALTAGTPRTTLLSGAAYHSRKNIYAFLHILKNKASCFSYERNADGKNAASFRLQMNDAVLMGSASFSEKCASIYRHKQDFHFFPANESPRPAAFATAQTAACVHSAPKRARACSPGLRACGSGINFQARIKRQALEGLVVYAIQSAPATSKLLNP